MRISISVNNMSLEQNSSERKELENFIPLQTNKQTNKQTCILGKLDFLNRDSINTDASVCSKCGDGQLMKGGKLENLIINT